MDESASAASSREEPNSSPTRRLRILILNYEFPPFGGGASEVSAAIGKGYVQRGHLVDVVTMGYRDLSAVERLHGMTVYRVPCLRSREDMTRIHELASYVISARRFLLRHLRHTRYDVSHAHFLLPTGPIARELKRRFGLPYLVSSHGSDVPGYNPDRFRRIHRFTKPVLRWVAEGADRIVTNSEYHLGLIRKSLHRNQCARVIHIPNGVDTTTYSPQPKDRIIVSTGRLLPRKGFQHLIRAVSGEDFGYELHIFGDGPMRGELQALAVHSKTPVKLHGWVDNKSKLYRDYLSRASIYVLASERENASMSLLEGMAAGCAVVTSHISGCAATLGEAGLPVSPGDSKAIGRQIQLLIRDDALRRSLQKRSRRRAQDNFAWNQITGRYERELLRIARPA